MQYRKWILGCSLFLNGILVVALAFGYQYLRFERIGWEWEAPAWATYAGTMDCIASHDNGVRRFYQLVTVTTGEAKMAFTGERYNGVEIWSWPTYPGLGEASQAANQAFVEAYNRRMRNFLADAATRPAD